MIYDRDDDVERKRGSPTHGKSDLYIYILYSGSWQVAGDIPYYS